MTDDQYKDWPLVPVDPACIPKGYEAVRVGPVSGGVMTVNDSDEVVEWRFGYSWYPRQRLIVRPIPKTNTLPTTIVPSGWWVAKDVNGIIAIYNRKPNLEVPSNRWFTNAGLFFDLAPPIAAQLPPEYLALPWDQSLMQQTESMR